MAISGKQNILVKKAYEIAYALCRIANGIKEQSFAGSLAGYGIALLNAGIRRNKEEILEILEGVNYFLNLGVALGYVSPQNAALIFGEIDIFQSKLEEMLPVYNREDIQIKDIFTDWEAHTDATQTKKDASQVSSTDNPQWKGFSKVTNFGRNNTQSSGNPAIAESEYLPKGSIEEILEDKKNISNEPNGFVSMTMEDRQIAVLEHIRQSGNCRIKDLQEAFPNYSERTLRYDIESLIARNLVQRIGGGSATFYRPVE